MIAEQARPDDDLDDAYHIIIAIKNKEYLDFNLGFTELEARDQRYRPTIILLGSIIKIIRFPLKLMSF